MNVATYVYRYTIAALLLCVFVDQPAVAQSIDDIGGTRFITAFPRITVTDEDARFPNRRYEDEGYFLIYSAVDNRVSVSGLGHHQVEHVSGGSFTVINPRAASRNKQMPEISGIGDLLVWAVGTVVNSTFSITAEHPVVVYQYLLTTMGAEMWTPQPVEAWGREYVVAALPGEPVNDVKPDGEFSYGTTPKMAPAEIVIMAAYNNTQVTIEPTGELLDSPETQNITLHAGQVYQVQSFVDTSMFAEDQPDIGGTRITATKPVGVISGNTRAMVRSFGEALAENSYQNMLIEWLRPVEQHGTEFVYMPTWDARNPALAGMSDSVAWRRGELVRIYRLDDTTVSGTHASDSGSGSFLIADSVLHEDFLSGRVARRYRTDRPAQAMMNSVAVVQYGGTTQGFGGYIGAEYDSWSPYMVEMTPREQWGSFSPYFAPTNPPGIEHYINLVTDSASRNNIVTETGARFDFNRGAIPGTDLVWGTMSVTAGTTHYIKGENGARFHGFVYGLAMGHEEYRPGRTRKKDGEVPTSLGHDNESDGHVLHPAEYESYLAVSYGYPMASMSYIQADEDAYSIDTTGSSCGSRQVNLQASNPSPVGIRSVGLADVVNARIVSVEPWPLSGSATATVVLGPVDPGKDAAATLVVTDRAGGRHEYSYAGYQAETVIINDGTTIDLGTIQALDTVERRVAVVNPLEHPVMVDTALLGTQVGGLQIVSVDPPALQLGPGDTQWVHIRYIVPKSYGNGRDSLLVQLACFRYGQKMQWTVPEPIIRMDDVTTGGAVGDTITGVLRICNTSADVSSRLSFHRDPATGSWIDFDQESGATYSLDSSEYAKLASSRLGSFECVDLEVNIVSDRLGTFESTARVYSNAVRNGDSATIRVEVLASGVEDSHAAGYTLTGAHPDPFSDATTLSFTLGQPGSTTVDLYTSTGTHVTTLLDRTLAAGEHQVRFEAGDLPSGVYHYRIRSDHWSATGRVVVMR